MVHQIFFHSLVKYKDILQSYYLLNCVIIKLNTNYIKLNQKHCNKVIIYDFKN